MSGNASQVFVVCGVFNSLAHTRRMLECLDRQTWAARKTILVDDGSTDGTREWLAGRNDPQLQVLHGDGSLWWTGSMALGISEVLRQARPGDFILTLNNDCTFDEHYIATLVELSLRHGKAVVGSVAIDQHDPHRIIDPGVRIDWRFGKIENYGATSLEELEQAEFNAQVDTISTRGTLYPVEVFQRIGNFDVEHLPHYLSDYELGCRAKRHGYPLLVSHKARVYNDGLRTGFGEPEQAMSIGVRSVYELMFARKSKSNIVDHWWFITLCCPPAYRLRNYRRLGRRSLRLMSFAMPMRPYFKKVKDLFFPGPAI